MTLEEMQKIARIISMADHGCPSCVGDLIREVNRTFPEFRLEQTGGEWTRRLILDDDSVSPYEDDYESYAVITVTATDLNASEDVEVGE